MRPRSFSDPFGSRQLALEQNILKLRAMQMLLVLFYAEELKRDVLSLNLVPKGTKGAVGKSLNVLVTNSAITAAEEAEIVRLIEYRNLIGHQMHNLLLDVSNSRVARDVIAYCPDLLPKYDYTAIERLRYFQERFGMLYKTHGYTTELRMNKVLFMSAEKVFSQEITRLKVKLSRLTKARLVQIDNLNKELSAVKGTEFEGDLYPSHPLNKYDDGRLTRRGIEICYRLFDAGNSPMTVAHLMGVSLISVRKRQKKWLDLGGTDRKVGDFAAIPHRKFYARHDD